MQNTLKIRAENLGAILSLPECSQTRTIERMSDSAPMPPQPPENVPTAAHAAPGERPDGEGTTGQRQKGKRKPNAMVRVARTVHALAALADGSAANKREAAQMMGIHPSNLQPGRIADSLASQHAPSLLSIDPLDVTIAHEGVRVSFRDILSMGMQTALVELAKLKPHIGKMDKTQREAFRQIKDWLTMCRENGLWKSPVAAPQIPGLPIAAPELADEDIQGSAAWYLRNMNRHREPEGATECGGITPAIPASA